MVDVFTRKKRSEVMSNIRGRGNKETELRMIQIFRASKIIGWQRSQALLGKPDFAFKKEKVAVFVDGCFWHACPRHGNLPANNYEFWQKKLKANKTRDRYVNRGLRKLGWTVVRVWEHELKFPLKVTKRVFEALVTSKTPS